MKPNSNSSDSSDSFDDRSPLGTNGRPHYVEIPVDDLMPGKFVTPCRGPFIHHLHLCELGPMNVTSEDRRFHGYPMQVLAVSLPYVSLRMMSCPANGQMLFAYDVRDVSFREVSEAYVKSLVNGVVDQGDRVANGGVESTNPAPAPKDFMAGF